MEHMVAPFLERRVFLSPLEPHDCAARFAARINPASDGRVDAPAAVVGSVSPRGFWLRPRIEGRDSFQTQAWGRFLATDGGTRIVVYLSPDVWLGRVFVLAIAAAVCWMLLAGPALRQGPQAAWLVPVLGIAAAAVFFVWTTPRSYRALLLQFIQDTVRARPLAAVDPPNESIAS